jgi:chromosome segregation ATPase
MHPRFQEVIRDRNEAKEQHATLQRELAELKQTLKAATPAQKDELMERLEKIDPEFGGLLKTMRNELKEARQQLHDLSGWRNQSSAQTTQQQITSIKSDFYNTNKVPENRRAIYEAMAKAQADSNPKLQISDLPQVMKQVHDSISKMFQVEQRATTKNFVDGKKNEASKPSTLPKGAPAKAGSKEQPVSKDDLRAQMIKEALSSVRGNKEI